jgi:diguanylate cyclase (GGDEF)-like protein
MGDAALKTPRAANPPAAVRVESELRALIRVSAAVAAAHRLDDVLETVAEESRGILAAASVSISRWEPEHNRVRTLINVGELAPGEARWPEGELWSLDAFPHIPPALEAGASTLVDAAEPGVPESELAVLAQRDKGSCLRVPIVFDGCTWGTLEAFSAPGRQAFTLEQAPFVEALATQVAVAIGRAELFSRVNALAYQDPLTGLANRRALEERLEAAVARASATGGALALLFCDLDRLKELNDSDGHEAGDAALVRVAEALTEAAADYADSFISRIGGDEFCVLLEGHGSAAAQALAQAAERVLERGDDGEEQLRMSCGAAELQHPRQRPADLFRAADAAQYVAKRAGRGRVYVAEAGVAARAGTPPSPKGGRRRMRDAAEPSAHDLLDAVLGLLNGRLADARVSDRLEAVAVAFADAYDAGGWAVSCRPPGADSLRTLFEGGRRAHRVSGVPSLRFGSAEDVYPLADYPLTAAALEAGGDFCVRAGDPDGDAAEQALLRCAGYRSMVAAAAVAGSGWLVELYADARSGPIEEARAALRLLTAEAVRAAA